jgi:hypothetical protein
MARVEELLMDMRQAAYAGDTAEVRRLAFLCKGKIAWDIEWVREGMEKLAAWGAS